MPELPWDKWYPQDWIADECLTLCSDATRGIWADVISRMMMSGTHQLTGSVIDLAKLCRTDKDAMTTAISELESTHTALVERCNGHVTLVSRRRSREVLARKQVRNRVRRFRDRHSEKPLKRNGNANVPSVSVSVSSSGSSLGIQEEGTGEGGSPSRMPADGWSWEQVWEVAQLPTVAVGKQTAQGYFDARTATA